MEQTVTYPNVAVMYDPIKRSAAVMVSPGVGETARFNVPIGTVLNILPSNDPFIQRQFADFIAG